MAISARKASQAAAFDSRKNTNRNASFKGTGKSAAFRGAANKSLRGGGGVLSAEKAGRAADQAYAG